MNIGLTTGCFDLLHWGHVAWLNECRKRCDKLFVGVDTDELVRKRKGLNRPIIGEAERYALVSCLRSVDAAFLLTCVTELDRFVKHFCVDVMFKSSEFQDDQGYHLTAEDKLSWRVYGRLPGVRLEIIHKIAGMPSTTKIIERIIDGIGS